VEHSTKEFASADLGPSSLADQSRTGGRAGRFQPKRSVWTMSMVVLDIDPQDLLQVIAADH